MNPKDAARARVEAARDDLIELSHRIHANPELRFEEEKAAKWLADLLEGGGMAVERGVHDLPTAFIARAGSGPLHVAICAEYDCLPAIGHACGHNIIAMAAAGAGLALAAVADEIGLTVSVIGTPGEEGGGGKILLLERGAFEGQHAAMMVHPAPTDVLDPLMIAVQGVEVRYRGKESHAAAYPQRGINAADALTVAQVAIGLLRQHIHSTDRIHGIVTKGGDAINVIPSHTTARYGIRARTIDKLDDLRAKVVACFEAGAVATGAELELTFSERPYAHLQQDADIVAAYRKNAEALGRTFREGPGADRFPGSTDMGNVSLALPSIHPLIGIGSLPAVNHQPEFAEHCATAAADKACIDGALAMAWTAIDLAAEGPLRERLLSRH
ncbi:MAG: M20 family metallopeptidase [Dehalococcoidia bacterium]